jgi:hypothetical protein
MSIIVDFKAGTVRGFVPPGKSYYPVKITGANDVTCALNANSTLIDHSKPEPFMRIALTSSLAGLLLLFSHYANG